jgi:phage-related protein
MKQIYTAFSFNGVLYTDLINVSLDNNMASESMRGNRTLLREKIPGRDIPYFYAVEDEALEFDVVFALTTPKTKAELKILLRNLISQTGYKELHFGNYFQVTATRTSGSNLLTNVNVSNLKVGALISGIGIPDGTTIILIGTNSLTMSANALSSGTNAISIYMRESPIYKVIFEGDSKLDFVGTSVYNEGVLSIKYLGYFSLKACADRPYGYENYISTINPEEDAEEGTILVTNSGDLTVFPNIVLTGNATTAFSTPVRIRNSSNNTFFTLSSLGIGEVVTVNSNLKTITSTVSGIYSRWTERDDLEFQQGANNLVFEKYTGGSWQAISGTPYWASVVFTFEAPTFIKE